MDGVVVSWEPPGERGGGRAYFGDLGDRFTKYLDLQVTVGCVKLQRRISRSA